SIFSFDLFIGLLFKLEEKIKIAAFSNTSAYIILWYYTYKNITDFKLLLILISSVVSLIILIAATKFKLSRLHNLIALIPLVCSVIIAFLFFTGLWVIIALLFGIVPFEPN